MNLHRGTEKKFRPPACWSGGGIALQLGGLFAFDRHLSFWSALYHQLYQSISPESILLVVYFIAFFAPTAPSRLPVPSHPGMTPIRHPGWFRHEDRLGRVCPGPSSGAEDEAVMPCQLFVRV
jgi:hypothetical protein